METFNWVIFIWQISLGISVFTLLYGFIIRSWKLLSISFFTSLPIAFYFAGANNGFQLIALIPVLLIVLTYVFKRKYS
ncbi:hypothetical protein SAMN05216389_106218 [Oceanobacillus limi]|uniref:Uncharacterized protein n=1 Tax=Oceanobacillus limi TaxID=930131 RepID=A0A1I0CHY1_9BACI|nr:hypothetical protein [Oceanobacillus limi]SET18576.1 hypothetical protein SAMN05216389_106218 [Oceanobacillus limi]